MELLTKLERKMFTFMESYISEHSGDAPTLAEIGSACGVRSVGTVHRYLSSMQEKGCVRKSRSGWRTRRPKTEGKTMNEPMGRSSEDWWHEYAVTFKKFRAAEDEISRLKEELKEAREIIVQLLVSIKPADGAWSHLDVHKNDLVRARAFLDRGE